MNIIESFKIKNKQRWIQRNTSQHGHLRRFNKKWCKWFKNKKNRKPKNQLNKVRKNSNGRTSSKTDVIIANANKGGAILIMNTDDYINEANHQLSDKDNYRQGLNDPTLQNNEMVNNTIEPFQKISKISCQKKKKKNCRRPKNIQSKSTKILYHIKDIQRIQSRKVYYKFHQLLQFWNIALFR